MATKRVTHGEMGDAYLKQYGTQRMLALDKWWKWDRFVWVPLEDVEFNREVWQVVRMYEFPPFNQSPTAGTVSSILNYLESKLYVAAEDLEHAHSPTHICMRNGVYDLRQDVLLSSQPEYRFTKHLDFDYDPRASCPLWAKFLADTLVKSPSDHTTDPELLAFVQEATGYSLTLDVSHHKAFWLFGDGGTGKSTFLYVLEHLLGPSALPFSLRLLGQNAYQLAQVPGLKVLFSTEVSRNTRLDTDIINSLISGDTMIVRHPYGRPFKLLPRAKIWWAMNYHPSAVNQIEGLGRRLCIIPFHRKFAGTRDDIKDLKELLVQAELSGIFNWAMEGLRRLQANGTFSTSAQIEYETEEFKMANDPPRVFVTEMCDVGAHFSVPAADLYDAYRSWCITNGFNPQSIRSVAQDWKRMGFEKHKGRHANRYLGLQLKP